MYIIYVCILYLYYTSIDYTRLFSLFFSSTYHRRRAAAAGFALLLWFCVVVVYSCGEKNRNCCCYTRIVVAGIFYFFIDIPGPFLVPPIGTPGGAGNHRVSRHCLIISIYYIILDIILTWENEELRRSMRRDFAASAFAFSF